MKSIIIRSPNGIADYTEVLNSDGTRISGVTAVDVRIRARGLVEATLQLEGVQLELHAVEAALRRKPGFWARTWALLLGEVPA